MHLGEIGKIRLLNGLGDEAHHTFWQNQIIQYWQEYKKAEKWRKT
jgi:hypothetical protein